MKSGLHEKKRSIRADHYVFFEVLPGNMLQVATFGFHCT